MERLTLEEAIAHAKEVAEKNYRGADFESLDSVDDDIKANCIKCAEEHEQLAEWLEELKSYKDAEDQGLLLRFPIEKNKLVYHISFEWKECTKYNERFDEYRCSGCEYECDSKKEYYITQLYLMYLSIETYTKQLGKTIFLTREEAEKKLKEMKNNGSKE